MSTSSPPWDVPSLLGPPGLSREDADTALAALVDDALGRTIDPASVAVAPVAYDVGSIATAALLRVHGRDARGEHWSAFVKVLQHPRHWPPLAQLPPQVADGLLRAFPWRIELDAWDPRFAALLPDGMRTPALYRVADLGDDRLAVWMEDVLSSAEVWNLARYARAARLLGRLNARGSQAELLALATFPAGFAARKFFDSLPTRGLDALGDDGVWHHPWLAPHADLRADLQYLAGRLPALLDALDALPQTLPHGDACPQNLLVPANAPETFVVIDVAHQVPAPVGSDLAQLAVGMVHAGEHRVAELPALHAVLGDAYLTGLADEGMVGDGDEVSLGYVGTMLIRSGFTSLPLNLLQSADDPVAEGAFAERVALTRFITETARPLVDKL